MTDYDVNRDGTDDVRIRLDSISGDSAAMTFTLLSEPDNTATIVTLVATAITLAVGVAGAIYVVLVRRRRSR